MILVIRSNIDRPMEARERRREEKLWNIRRPRGTEGGALIPSLQCEYYIIRILCISFDIGRGEMKIRASSETRDYGYKNVTQSTSSDSNAFSQN